MSDRIIIGESGIGGLPISAPARKTGMILRIGDAKTMRWLKDPDGHFRLIILEAGEWREIPCLTGE